MSQITKTAKSTMMLAAGAVAGVVFAGSMTTSANAETVYFGYETSFREAKQMCNGMHGRIFETGRGQYGCTGDLKEEKVHRLPPPASNIPRRVNGRGKVQNFVSRSEFDDRVSGGSGGGGGGNGGGGGSAGGNF